MIKRKLFFSINAEKNFLDSMSKAGYELNTAAPFTYIFEKTDRQVCYQYIPIKGGKRGFDALDYKNRDMNAKAVYAKSDIVLFKKSVKDGAFTIITDNELTLRLAKRRTKQNNLSLCLVALGALFATLGARAKAVPVIILSAIVLIIAFAMMWSAKISR